MKLGKTNIAELGAELERQSTEKRDFVLPSQTINAGNLPDWLDLTNGGDRYAPTDLFHHQLGDALNIPAKYYDRMRQDAPTLLAENVSEWLRRNDKRYMVRTLGGSARAFLSDRYRRIENGQLLETILPILREMPDAVVESCELTESKMYVKVSNPALSAEVRPGDVVTAGFVISNSEVGLGAAAVSPFVTRLVCRNGMQITDYGMRRTHIGGRILNEDAYELYSDETLQADDTAFLLKFADVVRTAVSEATFKPILGVLQASAENRFEGRVERAQEVVELTAKRFNFTELEKTGVFNRLLNPNGASDFSQWGLANAVTAMSAEADGYDRASELENIGWRVASMPRHDWLEMIGG